MCVLWPVSLFSLLMVAMVRAPWLIHICARNHPYVSHNSSVPLLIHTCTISHSWVLHDSFMYVPWLITMCATTHSYLCQDSFIFVPGFIHVCAMTHDIHTWAMTLSCVYHDACAYFHSVSHNDIFLCLHLKNTFWKINETNSVLVYFNVCHIVSKRTHFMYKPPFSMTWLIWGICICRCVPCREQDNIFYVCKPLPMKYENPLSMTRSWGFCISHYVSSHEQENTFYI